MKRFLAIAIAATMGLFYAGHANAGTTFQAGYGGTSSVQVTGPTHSYSAGQAANGVVQSRHNLGAFSHHLGTRNDTVAGGGQVNGTTQVCVFCHTPHHSNTDAKPLWNRNMPNSGNYVGYSQGSTGSLTIAGTNIVAPQAGSASLACLSCHDGVTTFDNLVNAPGKDGVTAPSATVVDLGWTFWDDGLTVITAKNLGFNTRVVLGTDLTNDHPVNVPYSGNQKASLRDMGTTISQINLSAGLNNTTKYFSWMQSNNWAVSGFISSTATISDLLRSASNGSNLVECSSCHDPHFDNGSYAEYLTDPITGAFAGLNQSDGVFLRRVGGNMGSGVCRTCHNK